MFDTLENLSYKELRLLDLNKKQVLLPICGLLQAVVCNLYF